MAAPEGNTYNKKFTTKKEREELCNLWCEHLSSGYSRESFPVCDRKTVYRVMKEFPEDFPAEKVGAAESANTLFWEKAGIEGMMGRIPSFNASSWIFNMKNRFGWKDKHEVDQKTTIVDETDAAVESRLVDLLRKAGAACAPRGETEAGE